MADAQVCAFFLLVFLLIVIVIILFQESPNFLCGQFVTHKFFLELH